MSINDDIANSIRRWPTLYRCRTDVLHQWFCVNGNGMDWADGRLVSWGGEAPIRTVESQIEDGTSWMRERLAEATENGDAIREAKYRVMIRNEAAKISFRMENADDLALVPWSSSLRSSQHDMFPPVAIYPLCQYACMNEVPDDVDQEYLAAVREMIIAVFNSQPNRPGISCYDEEHNAKVHESNIRFADGVLQDLARRFPAQGPVSSHAEWKDRMSSFYSSIMAALKRS